MRPGIVLIAAKVSRRSEMEMEIGVGDRSRVSVNLQHSTCCQLWMLPPTRNVRTATTKATTSGCNKSAAQLTVIAVARRVFGPPMDWLTTCSIYPSPSLYPPPSLSVCVSLRYWWCGRGSSRGSRPNQIYYNDHSNGQRNGPNGTGSRRNSRRRRRRSSCSTGEGEGVSWELAKEKGATVRAC